MKSDSDISRTASTPHPSGGGDCEDSGGRGAIDLNSYSKTPSAPVSLDTEKWVTLPLARLALRERPSNGAPVSLAVAFTEPLIILCPSDSSISEYSKSTSTMTRISISLDPPFRKLA